jgi:hypothetical protein
MKCLGGQESRIEAIGGTYTDSKSNRAVGEKVVRKSNYVGQTGDAPLSNVGLTDECIF